MSDSQPVSTPQQPPYYRPQRSSGRWWIPVLIIGGILMVIFFLFLGFLGMVGSVFDKDPVVVESNTVLHLDLSSGVDEYKQGNPFAIFGEKGKVSFYDLIAAIKRAKDDHNINGIFFEASNVGLGMAKTEEFMETLDDFKSSGKFVYSYMEMTDEMNYYTALPSTKIFMPEEGVLEMNGLSINSFFMKDMFQSLGIDFYVEKMEDFKSAAEALSRTGYSDSAKYQLRVILEQRYNMLLDGIEKYRAIPREKTIEIFSKGVIGIDSMKAWGLVDEFATRTELLELMKSEIYGSDSLGADSKLRLMTVDSYMQSDFDDFDNVAPANQQVAVIYGSGTIVPTQDNSPGNNELMITAKQFNKYLKEAREDDNVKVIILRIDSPGGSALISDEIYREIIETRKVKPVYASMSDVAASGGYYIAVAADTIIAQPSTITGSIGVISMIPNISNLLSKINVTQDSILTNPEADFLNPGYAFKDSDKNILKQYSSNIYRRFVEKVALNRNMSYEEAVSLAKGRVWTGADAQKMGLVDELGGLSKAISMAKEHMGYSDSTKVIMQIYPKPIDDLQALLKLFGLDEDNDNDASVNAGDFASLLSLQPSAWTQIYETLPTEVKVHFDYMLDLVNLSKKEQVLMAMPYRVTIK